MDWPGSGTMYGYEKQPAAAEEDEDGEEDFYGLNNANAVDGDNHATGGVSEEESGMEYPQKGATDWSKLVARLKSSTDQKSSTMPPGKITETHKPSTPNAEQRKIENQKKAADLRAKLIAQRQNTPVKGASQPRTSPNITLAQNTGVQLETKKQEISSEQNESSIDVFGLESLLAEGKAAAEAKMKQSAPSEVRHEQPMSNGYSTHNHQLTETSQAGIDSASDENTAGISNQPTWASKLTDAYYADLPIWLEVTGYHDVEYRNSKLSTYKERKSLEEEAARIEARLEKLRQTEQAEITSLRSSTARPAAVNLVAPPPLPQVMPRELAVQRVAIDKSTTPAAKLNGTKRARSPEPVESEKSLRRGEGPTNFRIRGANESPKLHPTIARRVPSPHATGMERRISYPEARRQSVDDYSRSAAVKAETRDPSLERRQAYYMRDMASAAPTGTYNRDSRYERSEYATHEANRGFDTRGRTGYSGVDRIPAGLNYREQSLQHKGSAGLDLRKGGIRYFMVKSWNHENVTEAMRDGLWATQEKNEEILGDAFRTSRHVVLLFSVNKSTAFQGYALMTSAPNPSLPKPPFCAKLNWSTSPAFTLRWLGTTSVHFKYVGHLKNKLNLDEHGQPMAVLVGKDGQEISAEAGMGVVRILDEAEDAGPASKAQPSAPW